MMRSMPNIASSGNMRPQSTTTMSSPYSKTYMFLPISPTPPSGIIRRGIWLSSIITRVGWAMDCDHPRREGDGLSGRIGHRCRPPRRMAQSLVVARAFADEYNLRIGGSFARNGLGSRLMEPTSGAHGNLRPDGVERRPALDFCHDAAPAPPDTSRRDLALTHPRSIRDRAISTALVAAPLRRLSLTTPKASPRSTDGSVRTRPTKISSLPAACVASG